MNILHLSLKNIFILALLVLYSADQALSIHCYECVSFNEGPCSSPTENQAAECTFASLMSTLKTNNNFLGRALESLNSSSRIDNLAAVEFECGKFTGTNMTNNKPMVARGCLAKPLSCEVYEKMMTALGFLPATCDRCGTDLCNSSSNLSVSFWSLCISLIMIVFLKM